ncbi:class I SAM-dependent methyltransferase [Capillimicrobium parvum]|uniref:class I SAM-dependent methyltransferase n=1 Tax=Capillimicrobium parvum TaxID=2884022 RepID=UPI00216AE841|nr:class I SAM-dependent methyltransferase [Capillimicrobium parvum]
MRLPPVVLDLARRVAGSRQLGQLVRAEPVLAAVRAAGGGELLDVGSGGLGLADFLDASWHVTAVDTSFDDYGLWRRSAPSTRARRVVGDVRALPFGDRSFDLVVALDVLEHVAPGDRAAALAELARVARRRVVVAAPAGAPALAADRGLAASLSAPPPWLEEHLANGLPAPADLCAPLAGFGSVRVAGNESCSAHVTVTRRELSVAWFVPTRVAARVLAWGLARDAAWARRGLRRVRGLDRPPVYRTVVILDL